MDRSGRAAIGDASTRFGFRDQSAEPLGHSIVGCTPPAGSVRGLKQSAWNRRMIESIHSDAIEVGKLAEFELTSEQIQMETKHVGYWKRPGSERIAVCVYVCSSFLRVDRGREEYNRNFDRGYNRGQGYDRYPNERYGEFRSDNSVVCNRDHGEDGAFPHEVRGPETFITVNLCRSQVETIIDARVHGITAEIVRALDASTMTASTIAMTGNPDSRG